MAKKKTYADEAKSIMAKFKPRLGEKFDKGDSLALEAMNQELTVLQQKQEKARMQKMINDASPEQITQLGQIMQGDGAAQQQPQIPQRQFGGDVVTPEPTPQSIIDRQRRLRDYQGQLTGGFAEKYPNVNIGDILTANQDTDPMITMQNFGDIGSGLVEQHGDLSLSPEEMTGILGAEGAEEYFNLINPRSQGATEQLPQRFGFRSMVQPHLRSSTPGKEIGLYSYLEGKKNGGMLPKYQLGGPEYFDYNSLLEPDMDVVEPWMTDFSMNNKTNNFGVSPHATDIPYESVGFSTPEASNVGFETYRSRTPWFPAAAQGVGAILANRPIDFGDERDLTAQQISPRLVDLGREREQIMRERDIAGAAIRRGARGRGTQQGLTQTTIAGSTGAQRTAGQQFGSSIERQQNINAQIRNQAAQFNAAQKARTDMLNRRRRRENVLINQQRKDARVRELLGAATGYGRDLISTGKYEDMLQMMTPENYQFLQEIQEKGLGKAFGDILQLPTRGQIRFKRGKERAHIPEETKKT